MLTDDLKHMTEMNGREMVRRQELLDEVLQGNEAAALFIRDVYRLHHWHTKKGLLIGAPSQHCPFCQTNLTLSSESLPNLPH